MWYHFRLPNAVFLRRVYQERFLVQSYSYLGATFLLGKQSYEVEGGGTKTLFVLGHKKSEDWIGWDVEEQDIYLV